MNKTADLGIIFGLLIFLLTSCSFRGGYVKTMNIPENTKTAETYIFTKDNLSLSLKYYIPTTNQKPATVLLLHQFRKDKSSWDKFIPMLLNNGYAVYSIDMRGHGKSNSYKDGKEIFYEDMPESEWNKIPHDIDTVMDFIRTNNAVDSSKIVVIGASIGANTAIIASSMFSDKIKTAVALSPGIEYHHLKTFGYAKTAKIPIMIAVAKDDEYARESSIELNKVITSKHVLDIYPGSEHGTNLLDITPDLQNKIVVWLNENLKK